MSGIKGLSITNVADYGVPAQDKFNLTLSFVNEVLFLCLIKH